MRVVEVTAFGGPEVLQPAERPDPEPAAGEVVVRIRAVNVNPTDLAGRSEFGPRYIPGLTPPFLLGWDLAGEIAAVGEGVTVYAAGDRVVGMIPWGPIGGRVGAYAEMAAVDPDWLAPLPDGPSFEEAATLPLNVLTAHQALDLLGLEPGMRLLITGASGGVGTFATQLAVAAGVHVVGVAGRDDEQWLAGLGAEEVLPRDADLSSIETVDAVLDAVPVGPRLATSALRDGGTAVFVRPPDPPEPDRDIRFALVMVHSDPAALRAFAQQLADGTLRTRVARTLPLAEAAEAHRLNEAGGLKGKVVLVP
jgi:NADPH:quinone reductase-like Zn-dependent oxidoreductase